MDIPVADARFRLKLKRVEGLVKPYLARIFSASRLTSILCLDRRIKGI
jgi:hypothetical protein